MFEVQTKQILFAPMHQSTFSHFSSGCGCCGLIWFQAPTHKI